MVCIYCGSPTAVSNSRLQHRNNHIWRRRVCKQCSGIFTTTEQPLLDTSYMVDGRSGLEPFNRDRLFLSIYDSCKHRKASIEDASALSQTIVAQLLARQHNGLIDRQHIVDAIHATLCRFDPTAAAIYIAYHPLAL